MSRSGVVLVLFTVGWLAVTAGIGVMSWRVWAVSLGLLAWLFAVAIFYALIRRGD